MFRGPRVVATLQRARGLERTVLRPNPRQSDAEEAVNEQQATAVMHYAFKTNKPISTLSMLVADGELWKIDPRVENDDPSRRIRENPEVQAYRLSVDGKHLPTEEPAAADGAQPAGSGSYRHRLGNHAFVRSPCSYCSSMSPWDVSLSSGQVVLQRPCFLPSTKLPSET